MSQKDIAGVVIVAFETEISVADSLVAKFSLTPIATALSAAATHMTARRIEASLPRANQNHQSFRAGNRERECELRHTSLVKKSPRTGPQTGNRVPALVRLVDASSPVELSRKRDVCSGMTDFAIDPPIRILARRGSFGRV